MRINLIFVKTAIVVLGLFSFVADDDFLNQIATKLDIYQSNTFSEKVYLHLDRPYYTAGERIWFAAYITMAATRTPDTLSRVLYVELINEQEAKIISRKNIKIINGIGKGDIWLSDSLKAGSYRIRAYTNWMRNFSDDFFFNKSIQIFQTNQDSQQRIPANADDIAIQFLPEGGNLVNGLESRIAFKATNVLDKGVHIKGFILNQSNDTLVGFESKHLGMGTFLFKPSLEEKYTVKIIKPNGEYQTENLPTIQPQGIVMMVDNLSNKTNLKVYLYNNIIPQNNDEKIGILLHNQGVVTYMAQTLANKKSLLFTIPKDKLGDGISHITVFNQQRVPLAERLIYNHADTPNLLAVSTANNSYKPRQKVELTIESKDKEGKPQAGDFSVAVTDASQVLAVPHAQNIYSYFMLESDLRGQIENPMQYFDANASNRFQNLDLLLMTQGWRRFEWKQALQDSLGTPKFFIEQGIPFGGKVVRLNNKTSGKANLTFMLQARDSSRTVFPAESDDLGNFGVYNLDITDSIYVFAQAQTEKGRRNFNITFNTYMPAPISIVKIPYNPIEIDAKYLADYLNRSKEYLEIERKIRESREKMLKEVVIKAKKEDPIKNDSRRALYGTPSNTVKFDQINTAGALSIFDVIRARVPGVQVFGSGFNVTVQIRGAANFSGVVEPLFLIDGVPVDKSAVINIPPNDVEAVDVLKGASAAMYGSRGGGGVIAILTKRANTNYDWNDEKPEGALATSILGYSPAMEFYSPTYDKPIPEHVRPDYRATVYWQPNVHIDSTGRATVSFYTSDAKTTLQVQIEGMSSTGKLGIGNYSLKVE